MAFLQEHNSYICKKLLQYVKNLFLEKCYTCSAKNQGNTWTDLSKDYFYFIPSMLHEEIYLTTQSLQVSFFSVIPIN